MKYRSKMISYFKVSYLLQLMTLLEIAVLIFLFKLLQHIHFFQSGNVFLKQSILFPFVLAPVFPQLDAYSRFQNYKLLKDCLYQNGFQARIIKPFTRSRCQRDAVSTAAEELGFLHNCETYFTEHGYKSYHIFPDFLFTHPETLICKAFWLNTFFVKKYQPKYDYKKISNELSKKVEMNILKELAVQ